MNAQEIKQRLLAGGTATPAERAYLLRNDLVSLIAFMIHNNPGSVNLALRKQGYTHLGFEPNETKLQYQLGQMIERGDVAGVTDVIQNFNLIPDGLNPEFIKQFRLQFNA